MRSPHRQVRAHRRHREVGILAVEALMIRSNLVAPHDRQIDWLGTLEDAPGIDTGLAISIGRTPRGMVTLSALAALHLPNTVACWTGRLAGFSPLRIRAVCR